MQFDDFDIKPDNFTDESYYLSFKNYCKFKGEECIIKIFVDNVMPSKRKSDDIVYYKSCRFAICVYYANTGDSVSKDDLEDIAKSAGITINVPSSGQSYVNMGSKGACLAQVNEEKACLILNFLSGALKQDIKLTIVKSREIIEKTGPCAKCGCVDKYNSPSPNFNNEVRCYIHWA